MEGDFAARTDATVASGGSVGCMVLQTIGDLLPAALGVALSPVPIVAIIVMLGTPRARTTGLAFALGWAAGLSIVIAVVVLVVGAAEDGADADPHPAIGWLKVGLGALFLVLAVAQWRHRPADGAAPEPPRWMATIDTLSPSRSLALGAALSAANPKNLALTVSAAASIADGALSAGGDVVAAAAFVLLGSLTVAGPTAWYLLAPRRAAGPLDAVKEVMSTHNAVIMATVLLLLGAKTLGDGIADLAS